MIRKVSIVIAVLTGLLAGCNLPTPGRTRVLGNVPYASAFATARETMAQYFSIESADPDTGQIVSRPKPVKARAERLLGGSPARHVATMHIRRKDGVILAQLSVALQREGSTLLRASGRPEENYDAVPNDTPADETAAVTPAQAEAWRTDSYDHALERRILNDVYMALHPKAERAGS